MFRKFIRAKKIGKKPAIQRDPSSILRPFSEDHVIVVPEAQPARIADAKDVFRRIDERFRNLAPSKKSPATKCALYETEYNARFARMFGSLPKKPQELVLSQGQIIQFCRTHKNLLPSQDETAVFFLFEGEGGLLIADVRAKDDGLYVFRLPFDYDVTWNATNRHRVVVPFFEI